jgi:hypothetical protein
MTIQKTCKECGHEQGLKFKRKKWRCSHCWTWNNYAIIAVLFLTISMGTAFAYEEKVDIPRSDYINKDCFGTIITGSDMWTWSCDWTYQEKTALTIPDDEATTLELDPISDTPIEDFLREIKIYLEETLKIEGEDDPSATGEGEQPVETTEADEELLDQFEKCFGGQEQAFAFQQEYEFEKFVRQYLKYANNQAKLAEECIAIGTILNFSNSAYPMKVVREDTSAKTIIPELKMSIGQLATPEKIKEEADRITMPSWYQDPYKPLTGKNRGNSEPIVSDRVDLFVGKSASQILKDYQFKRAADILTQQDLTNIQAELNKVVCEIAWKTSGNGNLHISKWRIFLADGWCNDKVDTFFFKGEHWKLEDIIKYKQDQAKSEIRPDLRVQK